MLNFKIHAPQNFAEWVTNLSPSWGLFLQEVEKLLPGSSDIKLRYRDAEGEFVTFSSEVEWEGKICFSNFSSSFLDLLGQTTELGNNIEIFVCDQKNDVWRQEVFKSTLGQSAAFQTGTIFRSLFFFIVLSFFCFSSLFSLVSSF